MQSSGKWFHTTAMVLAPLLILGLASQIAPVFNYNRWDNFEQETPNITEAHFQWLEGRLPQWNPHPFMGEPLLSAMTPGVFYFGYTLCCLLIKLLGLSRSAFPLISVLFHSAIAMIGWRLLFARIGVRPLISLLLGAGYTLGGFLTDISAVWLFTAAHMAWLPWIMFAVIRFADEPGRWNAALLAAVLAIEMYIGYVQFSVYSWVFAGIFAAGYVALVQKSRKAVTGLLAVAAIAALASGPFLVPAFSYAAGTERGEGLRLEEFLERSVEPQAAMDVLLPVYLYDNGFMKDKPSIYLHQGAWIAPPLIAAALLWRRRRGSDRREAQLWRLFWMALLCAALFYVLALGSNGYLLSLTYRIPFWSSFRWPFKFIPFCLAPLVLASGIGLEFCWREERAQKLLWAVAVAVPAVAFLLLLANDSGRNAITGLLSWHPSSAAACVVAGLTAMWAVLRARRRWARMVLLLAAPVELVALMVFCQAQLSYKTYPDEPVGPEQLGIDGNYRVLPLSSFDYDPDLVLGEYASFSSATWYGYYSATGCQTAGLLPKHYLRWFSLLIDGVPRPATLPNLLGSSLLRSFNVRYLVAARNDFAALELVRSKPAYTLKQKLARTLVYEDSAAMPRIYFARRVLKQPADYAQAVAASLLTGREPPTTAIIDTSGNDSHVEAPEDASAPAEVTGVDWQSGAIRTRVKTSGKSFLVISATYSPGWNAWVDGTPGSVHLVNGTIMGIDVPPGIHEIRLQFITPGLWAGLLMCFSAMIWLAFWNRWPTGNVR